MRRFFVLWFTLVGLWGCGQDGGGQRIVIGGLFADGNEDTIRRDLFAARLAVDEINATGVFSKPLELVNYSPALGELNNAELAAQGVEQLYDQDRALAFLSSHGAEISEAAIEVTNRPAYQKFVQCNSGAAEPSNNLPGMAGADETDAFYRTIISFEADIDVGTHVFIDRQWKNIGLVRVDNSFGEQVVIGLQLKIGEYSQEGFSLVFDEKIPDAEFDLETNRDMLDRILAAADSGEVDVTIIAVLHAQARDVIKHLVENGYAASFFLGRASAAPYLFDEVDVVPWQQAGHEMLAIWPDGYQGKHSQVLKDQYRERYSEEVGEGSATTYDCTYAVALAMLYAGESDLTPQGVWEKMKLFKDINRAADETEVGIGSDEFTRAAGVIATGGRIDFQGASGRLLFDENGDRPKQGMIIAGPNSTGDAWEAKERYDEDKNKL